MVEKKSKVIVSIIQHYTSLLLVNVSLNINITIFRGFRDRGGKNENKTNKIFGDSMLAGARVWISGF